MPFEQTISRDREVPGLVWLNTIEFSEGIFFCSWMEDESRMQMILCVDKHKPSFQLGTENGTQMPEFFIGEEFGRWSYFLSFIPLLQMVSHVTQAGFRLMM